MDYNPSLHLVQQ